MKSLLSVALLLGSALISVQVPSFKSYPDEDAAKRIQAHQASVNPVGSASTFAWDGKKWTLELQNDWWATRGFKLQHAKNADGIEVFRFGKVEYKYDKDAQAWVFYRLEETEQVIAGFPAVSPAERLRLTVEALRTLPRKFAEGLDFDLAITNLQPVSDEESALKPRIENGKQVVTFRSRIHSLHLWPVDGKFDADGKAVQAPTTYQAGFHHKTLVITATRKNTADTFKVTDAGLLFGDNLGNEQEAGIDPKLEYLETFFPAAKVDALGLATFRTKGYDAVAKADLARTVAALKPLATDKEGMARVVRAKAEGDKMSRAKGFEKEILALVRAFETSVSAKTMQDAPLIALHGARKYDNKDFADRIREEIAQRNARTKEGLILTVDSSSAPVIDWESYSETMDRDGAVESAFVRISYERITALSKFMNPLIPIAIPQGKRKIGVDLVAIKVGDEGWKLLFNSQAFPTYRD